MALFLSNLLNLFSLLSSSQLQGLQSKSNHSFPCLKKMLFSLTAPVQSHLSFTLSGSPFDPCFVCHSSFSLHTENILTQRLCSSGMSDCKAGLSRAQYVILQPPMSIPLWLWASGHSKHTFCQYPGSQTPIKVLLALNLSLWYCSKLSLPVSG